MDIHLIFRIRIEVAMEGFYCKQNRDLQNQVFFLQNQNCKRNLELIYAVNLWKSLLFGCLKPVFRFQTLIHSLHKRNVVTQNFVILPAVSSSILPFNPGVRSQHTSLQEASDAKCNVYRTYRAFKCIFLAFMVVNTINHSLFIKNRFLSFWKSMHLH